MIVCSVEDILSMQDSVTEFCRNDGCGQIRLDPILNDAGLEDGVDCGPSRRCHLQTVCDEFADASGKFSRDRGECTSDDLH